MGENLDHSTLALVLLELGAALLSAFFALQLFNVKHFKAKSNRYLALFFLIFCFVQVFRSVYHIGLSDHAQQILFLFTPVILLLAPTIYLYIQSLVSMQQLPVKKRLLHYVLPAIFFVLCGGSYIGLLLLDKDSPSFDIVFEVFSLSLMGGATTVFPLQNFFYIAKSILAVRKHNESIQHIFSYEKGVNLKWMQLFLAGYVIFILGAAGTEMLEGKTSNLIFDVLLLGYIIYIGFQGNRQIDIYLGVLQSHQNQPPANSNPASVQQKTPSSEKEAGEANKKHSSFLQDTERADALKTKLLDYMEQEKPYLNKELNIFDVSKSLETNSKYISELINQTLDKNFIQFVNEYRVEEAKKLLLGDTMERYTIETVAEKSGFKSKSTFYNAFKKITGQTPAAFKREKGE